jgi:hypothetical protein
MLLARVEMATAPCGPVAASEPALDDRPFLAMLIPASVRNTGLMRAIFMPRPSPLDVDMASDAHIGESTVWRITTRCLAIRAAVIVPSCNLQIDRLGTT